MIKFFLYNIILLLMLCSAGCGTFKQVVYFPDQSKFVEEEGKGRIYVIGNPLFMNMASYIVTLTVVADQKWIGDIVGHSYLCWEREPGITIIRGRQLESNIVNLTVESGKAYYVTWFSPSLQ